MESPMCHHTMVGDNASASTGKGMMVSTFPASARLKSAHLVPSSDLRQLSQHHYNSSLTIPLPFLHALSHQQQCDVPDTQHYQDLRTVQLQNVRSIASKSVLAIGALQTTVAAKAEYERSEQSEVEIDGNHGASKSTVELKLRKRNRLDEDVDCSDTRKLKMGRQNEISSRASTSTSIAAAADNEKNNLRCSICGELSTGIHFGADSCAACSAFFRRTVSLNRIYFCNGNGTEQCGNLKGSSSCKKCRFEKCVSVGMDMSNVQCHRDSIGHYSTRAKFLQSVCPRSLENDTILHDLVENIDALNYRRQLLYSMNRSIEEIFDEKELPIRELESVSECFYQLTHIEPRLAADFMNTLPFLKKARLSSKELLLLYKNFDISRQAVEEPYLTYKHDLLQQNCWVMLNRNYVDLSNTQKYFENGTMNELALNRRTAENLFIPSLQNAIANVSARMRKHKLTEVDFAALYGVALADPGVRGLSEATREKLLTMRGLISKSLLKHYQDSGILDPEIKLGALYIDVYTYSKVHAITTAENMQLLDIFKIFQLDRSG